MEQLRSHDKHHSEVSNVHYQVNFTLPMWSLPEKQPWMTSSPESTYIILEDSFPAAPPSPASYVDPCDVSNQIEYPDLTQIPWVLTVLSVAYLLVIVFSICGNALVILTVWRNAHMHTVTNYYIVNLAVSDFLVSVCVMPLKLLEYTSPCEWNVFANPLLCPIISYILPIFVFASVLTLVAISLER